MSKNIRTRKLASWRRPSSIVVPYLYDALMIELRRHIQRRGWNMRECDDRAGLGEGHTSHLLSPRSPTGRIAQIDTLSLLAEAVAGRNFRVLLVPEDFDPSCRSAVAEALEEQHDVEVDRVVNAITVAATSRKVPKFA